VPGTRRRKPAPFLDRVIHEPVRLAIVAALAANGGLTFKDLKARLGATDGNLGVHARRLEAAGYVGCSKTFAGRMPRTEYRLTAKGRRAFDTYRDRLATLIGAAATE
jgi:DNA-binding MarR family transcriptional regulator